MADMKTWEMYIGGEWVPSGRDAGTRTDVPVGPLPGRAFAA